MDTSMTDGLSQHWVSVVDEQGRERLEARWLDPALLAESFHAA